MFAKAHLNMLPNRDSNSKVNAGVLNGVSIIIFNSEQLNGVENTFIETVICYLIESLTQTLHTN